jgi:Acetyltransferases, including N-acetylases of ribosomal proteins
MNVTLEGRNARLRPLVPDDAERTQRWRTGGRAYLLNKGAQSVDEQRAWIVGRPPSEIDWIIELTNGDPVGMLALVDIDPTHRRAEAGHFLIGEPEPVALYGPGCIAAEAELLLFAFAFDTLKLHRLDAMMAEDNAGIIAWNTYIGFREEGRLKHYYWLDGHWQDCVRMGLLEYAYRTYTIPRLRGFIRGSDAHP